MSKKDETKEYLLTLAREGKQRPTPGTPLGTALARYASPKGSRYDVAFATQIQTAAPTWLRPAPTATAVPA